MSWNAGKKAWTHGCAKGALECGSDSYRFSEDSTAAPSLPQSKALRAISWLMRARQPTGVSGSLGLGEEPFTWPMTSNECAVAG